MKRGAKPTKAKVDAKPPVPGNRGRSTALLAGSSNRKVR